MSESDVPWHERDAFWRVMARVMFQDPMWERAEQEVSALVERLELGSGDALLDLGCGPGRHALELAAYGCEVTGVDRTRALLERGKAAGRRRGLDVEWVEADMREFCRDQSFDAAVNLYTTFGYFEDPSDNQTVLENLRRSLKPGGWLVMEMTSKEFIAANFKERTWQELDDGTLFLARREVEGAWEWIANRWVLVEPDGTRHDYNMRHRLYSAVELRDRLEAAGFASVEIAGGFEGEAYDRDTTLVAFARRAP